MILKSAKETMATLFLQLVGAAGGEMRAASHVKGLFVLTGNWSCCGIVHFCECFYARLWRLCLDGYSLQKLRVFILLRIYIYILLNVCASMCMALHTCIPLGHEA